MNSTLELIDHFTACYEAVRPQLQDEHGHGRQSAGAGRPAKQARHVSSVGQSFDRKHVRCVFVYCCCRKDFVR
jgi:hypothetical protein